ncbi:MAG TPA: type I-MYXAN CRISPR-associated protein Cas6/Cmx6 [Cyanobacteria bacterium UBA11372]|nr:type I-MYXAN CRISPR-associated protein Cas6/Cmx6 [Cyanobacteria bacterium UBA11372]
MLITQTKPTETSDTNLPFVDLCFSVIGSTAPADHNYALHAAIKHLHPELLQQTGVSIQTITGIPDGRGKIYLSSRSRFRMRLPGDLVPLAYPLAGKQLKLGIHQIRLGIPQIYMLQPASRLRSRIVVIKGYQEPEEFLAAAKRQLNQLGISGTAAIPTNTEEECDRKTIKIKRFTVIGFGLEVIDLNDEDSLKLQIHGIGGKQKMGCGVFVPVREAV